MDLNKGVLLIGNKGVPVKRLAVVGYQKDGTLFKNIKNLRDEGVDAVYMVSYHKWLIVDDFYYNSTFFQLFIFQNTKGLFKPVIITPYVKVYKLIK